MNFYCQNYTIYFIQFIKLKDSITWMCDAIASIPTNSIQGKSKYTLLLLLRIKFTVGTGVLSYLNKNCLF